MANGYLGKISAIVSANTADFQSKINASAQDVGRFAKRVESDLNAASRQASRSLENIYTPLQKVERALKAANSMKLSFQGFKGAVRTVEELSQRLAELGKRQIDISVRGTGFKTAAQLHDAIRGISSKEVNLVASVGGLKEARELVASMQAADEYGKRRGVAFGKDTSTGAVVKVRQTQLEEAVAKLAQFRDLDQIKIALKVVGTQQLDEATRKFKQMVSLGQEVTAPLEKIQSELSSFPADIQAAFQPTLIELQKRTERVSASIEKVGTTGRTFNRLTADVRGATQSVGFLSEAVASLGAINARGIVDRAPAFKQALDSSAAATKMRDSQPAFVTRNADVGALDERRLDAVNKLVAAYAKLEGEESRGGASAKTSREFERQVGIVNQLTDSFNELVASTKGAAFDEIALQANRANAIFSTLSPQAARGLLALQKEATGLIAAYRDTGAGAAQAEAAIRRLSEASSIASSADKLRTAAAAIGDPSVFASVEAAAARTLSAFDALPESLRQRFSPEMRKALGDAASLGDAVSAGGARGTESLDRMVATLGRLQSAFKASGNAAQASQALGDAASRVRVRTPVNVSAIANQATAAVGEFETLSEPIRRQLIPAFSDAIGRAAALAQAIRDGGSASVSDINAVAKAVGNLSAEMQRARAYAELVNTGLFKGEGGSRSVEALNTDVRALSDSFKTLPASSRTALAPFVKEVKDARSALRAGAGSVRDYQAAVSALAAATKSISATSGAFVSDNSSAGRAKAVADLEARITSASKASEDFGRAARRSLQDVAEAARAAAAAFAAGVQPLSAAERAIAVLEERVDSIGRGEGIKNLFRVGSESTQLDRLLGEMKSLDERFAALDITQRRALQNTAKNLKAAAQAAAEAGRATTQFRDAMAATEAGVGESETRPAENRRRVDAANQFLLPPVLQRESEILSNQGLATDVRGRLARAAQLRQIQEARTEAQAEQRRRVASANEFMLPPVLQRESELISNQGLATDVRARLAAAAAARQRQEQRDEARAEQRRRVENANQFLLPPVLQDESRALSNQGSATRLGQNYFSDSLRSRATQLLGRLPNDPAKMLSGVGQSIVSLQSQIESLPGPLQARMIPAIIEAREEFRRLNAIGPHATAQEIEAARASLIHLTQDATRAAGAMNFSRSFGGEGVTGVGLGLDQNALRGVSAQLQILQGYIGRVSRDARGPAVAAFNELRNAAAAAFAAGTLDTPAVEQELARLRTAATRTTATLARVNERGLGRELGRAGDIGRQGVDRWSLALNQAAFAVDDFLSSTGGIEFKLRAVSNNITQLAFVLGGTTGLFVGLGAVLAGQAAVALIRWANNGRSAEDQTRALNDALARQKNLVEELGQSFKSLGDSVARGLFSDAGEKAADFARQLEAIQRKQAEVAAERRAAANSSPAAPQNLGRTIGELYAPPLRRQEFQGVAEIRAELNKLQKELEGATTAGERAITQGRIRTTRQQERAALNRLSVEPAPDDTVVRSAVRNSARESGRAASAGQFLFSNIVTGFSSLLLGIDRERTSQTVDAAGRLRRLSGEVGSDPQSQVEVLRRAQELKRPEASQRDFFGLIKTNSAISAEQEIAKFEELIQSLQNVIDKGLNKTANEIVTAARGPAEAIRQAQEEVAKAIEAGLPGARLFGLELDAAAKRLEEANKRLEQFASGKDENGRDLTDADREKRVDEAKAEVDTLRRQQAAIEARTDGFRRERTLDPQRQIDARLGRAAGNLQAAGMQDGAVARQMRDIEYQRETIRRQAMKPEFQTPAARGRLEKQEAALNAEAAAIEAATIQLKAFADALNRATEEAKGNLNSAQQAADEARRADLAMSTPQTQEARRIADANLERQRELERRVQNEAKADLERQAKIAASPEALRIRQIDEEMQSGSGAKREELIRERAQLQAKVDKAARESAAGLNAARDVSTAEAERARMAARGAEMAKTPEQRFNEETRTGLASIGEYFKREANGGPVDAAGQRRAEQRYMEDRGKEFRQQTSVGRGVDLMMTEQERFARDIREGAAKDLGAAAKEMQAAGKPRAEVAAFLRQGIQNQMEQVAPMFKQFEDERRTAQLQGPSRAALQVSDVTTTGGASELTRLLRGDDSAKNENLAELRRQSEKLDEVVKAVRESAPGVL